MAAKKLSGEEWAEYLEVYARVKGELSSRPWFKDGWEIRTGYINKERPTGVWLQLVRGSWFDGAIHLETWVNNGVLERKAAPVALHIETSKERHGLSRNDFTRVFLEHHGDTVAGWDGYTLKPNYAMEPFSVQVPFTRETLAATLENELSRVQQLGVAIDETIEAVAKPMSAG